MRLSESGITDEIDHHEEYFLRLIEGHDLKCPLLDSVWEQFYDGSRIYPNHAESISKELDVIDAFISTSKDLEVDPVSWSQTYKRLRGFFSMAHELGEVIHCISD